MESRLATMTKASRAGATPLQHGLPEEIIFWEILVRLPPESLLRCRAVCRAWRRATSTRPFLQAHHGRQPSLPIVCCYEYRRDAGTVKNILAFEHRASSALFQPVVRIGDSLWPGTSCDGLLILSRCASNGTRIYSVYNPATHQHAPLGQLSGFTLLGMYEHRPTGEYRLLLQRTLADLTCCYAFALGSDQPPRYIEKLEGAASAYLGKPALVRDSLHWCPEYYESDPLQSGSNVVIVFDTTSESFRQMRAPVVATKSYIFEMDGTLGIYCYSDDMTAVDIWVLRNYEVWTHKYNVKLPDTEVKRQFELSDDEWEADWDISVHSVDGDVLLLVGHDGWMFYVDMDGKLVGKFQHDGQHVYTCDLRLKQTLVLHTLFTTLEGYSVNALPFIREAVE